MLVPYKNEEKNIQHELINNQELNLPVKLNLLNKNISKLKNETRIENVNEDSNKIKKFLNKKHALKTINKLNEIYKIINKRIQKLNKNDIINNNNNNNVNKKTNETNLTEIITPIIDEIVHKKKPVKRQLEFEKPENKKQKINNINITKGHEIEYLPNNSIDYSDSDYEYNGKFTEYRNTPIDLEYIKTNTNNKKINNKQIKKKLKKFVTTKANLDYIPDESMILSENDDADVIDPGEFKRYAIKPKLQDFMINTRNRNKNWSEFKND